jgi:hypothetical protein
MNFVRLTEAQRTAFADDGFLVVAMRSIAKQWRISAKNRIDSRRVSSQAEISGKPSTTISICVAGCSRKSATGAGLNSTTVPLVVQVTEPEHSSALDDIIYKRPENPDDPPFRRGWHRDIRIPKIWATNSCRSSASRSVTA